MDAMDSINRDADQLDQTAISIPVLDIEIAVRIPV